MVSEECRRCDDRYSLSVWYVVLFAAISSQQSNLSLKGLTPLTNFTLDLHMVLSWAPSRELLHLLDGHELL